MTFMVDVQELKSGLVIFRRTDVLHTKWCCQRGPRPNASTKYSHSIPNRHVHRLMFWVCHSRS
jgi:hypothetical protein